MPTKSPEEDPVLLVGNPNVGKSLLFGLLTQTYVAVSNYPGTTVEIADGTLKRSGGNLRLIDTPGVNTLIPTSEDEKVTRWTSVPLSGQGGGFTTKGTSRRTSD